MNATESTTYTMKQGGGVIIRDAYFVTARNLLTAENGLRKHIRERLLHNIYSALEEKTGLPFELAITNIDTWRETEEDPEPGLNFQRNYYDRSVLLVTTCVVRRVEYPEAK